MTLWRILAVIGLLAGFAPPAQAQNQALSEADRGAIRQTIRDQVEAFRRDDDDAAFSYASPTIQTMFGTSASFMAMVRRGYQPVYRPRSFAFREIVTLNGAPTQKVDVVGPDGRAVTAFYPMVQLPDGRWRIDGCYFSAPDDPQA